MGYSSWIVKTRPNDYHFFFKKKLVDLVLEHMP